MSARSTPSPPSGVIAEQNDCVMTDRSEAAMPPGR
jgi:hypothetical protein